MVKMVKMVKKIVSSVILVVLLLLSLVPSSFAAQPEDKNQLLLQIFNDIRAQKGLEKVSLKDIPTIDEINKAMKNINVSKDSPVQVIDVGKGVTIVARVTEERQTVSAESDIVPNASQSLTAKGEIYYEYFGVKWYSLSISVNYSYDDKTYKILTYQDPPSVNAYGFVGWVAQVTNKDIVDLDPAAKDAIGDAEYNYLKYGGTVAGHIELRFTATGNYYIHDSYFFES